MLMSTIAGSFDKIEYWSITTPNPENSALFQFNEQTPRNQLKIIQNTLQCIEEDRLSHADKFIGIRKIIAL